jgi:hypothetical protein
MRGADLIGLVLALASCRSKASNNRLQRTVRLAARR